MKRMISYRLDDITEDMDWNKFLRAQEIFKRYQIKPLIGVVPCNQDSKLKVGEKRQDFFVYIRQLQEAGWTIAQHGYKHIYETTDAGLLGLKKASEFAGLPRKTQSEKLRAGKKILEENGVATDIFMAPGHTYDIHTLEALAENGFHYVTDGYTNGNYLYKGLTFIPCRSTGLSNERGIDTVCLHVNDMQEIDFEELEQSIADNRNDIVDFARLLKLPAHQFSAGVRLQERKNLLTRKLKRSIAGNPVIHAYLKDTNAETSKKKWMKRILGLPKLMIALIFRNGDDTCSL